jgi:hypothetical protein
MLAKICFFSTYFFSFCNQTHDNTDIVTKELVRVKLPRRFQNHVICAGSTTSETKGQLSASMGFMREWSFIGTKIIVLFEKTAM